MSKETITKQSSDESQKRKRKVEQTQLVLPHPTTSLQRLTDASALSPTDILSLQQTVGNQAVQRTLAERGQHKQETNDGKTDLGVVQRHPDNDTKIAALNERVTIAEATNQGIIEWTALKNPKIDKVDKIINHINNKAKPWGDRIARRITSIEKRVTNLESATSKKSTP